MAVVGQTDEEVVGSGVRCWCGTIPLDLVPRAGATHQTNGIAKIVIRPRHAGGQVAFRSVMPNAGEVISRSGTTAMRFHAKLEDFIDLIHVYPTMAEALKDRGDLVFQRPRKVVLLRGIPGVSALARFMRTPQIFMTIASGWLLNRAEQNPGSRTGL
ncbi:MAG: hypothetical protein M0C28_30605 [Candidatus Moduliflexus flocculans]|nr:hypothetical protein [Candidatus Moduliflexus flocculans]